MIKIVSDSACDLTQAEAAALDVELLPLKVAFGEEEYLDGLTLDHDGFFEKLVETDTLPKTSQITPFRYEECYQKHIDNGDEVLCIALSSALSGCYQSACLAAEDFGDQVAVVDSLNACVGQRILVERAATLRDQGLSLRELAAQLEIEKKQICLIALLDTLEYLKKGGRISPAVAAACNLLSIKPVITIEDGKIALLGKARGSKNGQNKLTEYIKKAGGINFDKPYCLAYSGLSDHLLRKYVLDSKSLYDCDPDELPVSSIGAAIGTHIGPGAIAAVFFKKD